MPTSINETSWFQRINLPYSYGATFMALGVPPFACQSLVSIVVASYPAFGFIRFWVEVRRLDAAGIQMTPGGILLEVPDADWFDFGEQQRMAIGLGRKLCAVYEECGDIVDCCHLSGPSECDLLFPRLFLTPATVAARDELANRRKAFWSEMGTGSLQAARAIAIPMGPRDLVAVG